MMHGQRGQALLEGIIALALLLIVSVWAASEWNAKVQQVRVKAMAAWLLEIQKAIGQDSNFAQTHMKHDSLHAANTWSDSATLVQQLKRESRLPEGFSEVSPLGYQVELMSLHSNQCEKDVCAYELLLLAKPGLQMNQADVQYHAMDLLLALNGKGAAVLETDDRVLKGAGIRHQNPPPGHARLPVGTVALLLWRSDHLSPYVRLQEDRAVHLSGAVTVDGQTYFERPLLAKQGVVLQGQVEMGTACQSNGHLKRLTGGGLALCEFGRWRAVANASRKFQSCAVSHEYGDALANWLLFQEIDASAPRCDCASGYIARYLGRTVQDFEGIRVFGGFICEQI